MKKTEVCYFFHIFLLVTCTSSMGTSGTSKIQNVKSLVKSPTSHFTADVLARLDYYMCNSIKKKKKLCHSYMTSCVARLQCLSTNGSKWHSKYIFFSHKVSSYSHKIRNTDNKQTLFLRNKVFFFFKHEFPTVAIIVWITEGKNYKILLH